MGILRGFSEVFTVLELHLVPSLTTLLFVWSSDEFNANFPSEVDRVADYVAAAALVPESDFVSQRLRERAVKLLGLEADPARKTGKLLNQLYSIRSRLVHGSPLSEDQMLVLQDRANSGGGLRRSSESCWSRP